MRVPFKGLAGFEALYVSAADLGREHHEYSLGEAFKPVVGPVS